MMLWYLAFCYAISFYIQLWIATVAFSPKMEKRRGFAKRAFLGSLPIKRFSATVRLGQRFTS